MIFIAVVNSWETYFLLRSLKKSRERTDNLDALSVMIL